MQHGPGLPSTRGILNRQCQQFSNPLHYGALARALLVALDRWVRDGTEPPESRVPRIDEETLVSSDQNSTRFPSIPAGPTWNEVTYDGVFNASGERDFGPRVHGNRGIIDNLIPIVLSEHRVLVPKVDHIGNDIAGIRHPFVEAPIATHTGWNLRTPEFTDGDLCPVQQGGMMVPLFKTKAERLAQTRGSSIAARGGCGSHYPGSRGQRGAEVSSRRQSTGVARRELPLCSPSTTSPARSPEARRASPLVCTPLLRDVFAEPRQFGRVSSRSSSSRPAFVWLRPLSSSRDRLRGRPPGATDR